MAAGFSGGCVPTTPTNPALLLLWPRLLDARQAAILLRDGYDKFSMNAVAVSAKTSKETLYRHFNDKAGLLTAALINIGKIVEPLLLEGLHDKLDRQQRLKVLAENYLKGCVRPESLALQKIAFAEGQHLGLVFAKQFTEASLTAMTRQFVRMGTPNPKLDAEVFLAMVQGQVREKALLGAISAANTKTIKEVTQHAVAIFSAYLGRIR